MRDLSNSKRREETDLKRLDDALIRALQEDGRASISKLASSLEEPRALVARRLRSLLDGGELKVAAAVDPGFVGHQVLVHGTVDVDGAAEPVASQLQEHPEAVLVSLVSGSHPIVFESRHRDHREMDQYLEKIRRIPKVRLIRTNEYAEVLKGFFVSHRREGFEPDQIDLNLIGMLQRDGRIGYTALANSVHLSPSSVRERVARLLDSGVIRISALQPGGIARSRFSIGLGVSGRGELGAVRCLLSSLANVEFAARTYGAYDFIATATGHSAADVLSVVEELRAADNVYSLESWTHLNLVKEEYARVVGRLLRT